MTNAGEKAVNRASVGSDYSEIRVSLISLEQGWYLRRPVICRFRRASLGYTLSFGTNVAFKTP